MVFSTHIYFAVYFDDFSRQLHKEKSVFLSEVLVPIISYMQMIYVAFRQALMANKIFAISVVILQKNMKLFLIVQITWGIILL